MASLKEINKQAELLKQKIEIDLTDIKDGARVEYVPSKYMSLFEEFNDETTKVGLKKLEKHLKGKQADQIDMNKAIASITNVETVEAIKAISVNQAEQIIGKFKELPSVEEIKEHFEEIFDEDLWLHYYEDFMINDILKEFNEAFGQAIPPSGR